MTESAPVYSPNSHDYYAPLLSWLDRHTIWHKADIDDMGNYHGGNYAEIQLTLTLPELKALWEARRDS